MMFLQNLNIVIKHRMYLYIKKKNGKKLNIFAEILYVLFEDK